jgi:hypothetical protein
MTLMVQDLTNPMLAQIPHVLLAAHAGTIMGVETNAMQFYPEASRPRPAFIPASTFTLAESALLDKLLHSIQPCLIGYAVIHPEAAALETGFSMNGAM